MSPRTRGSGDGPVTAERVVTAALRVIDADGLDALTMRRLAHDLGVEPVTVYRQLASKEAILAAVAERLWREVRPVPEGTSGIAGRDVPLDGAASRARVAPRADGGAEPADGTPFATDEGHDWRAQVRSMWLGLYAVMLAHPNAIPIIAKGGSYSTSAADGTAGLVSLLRDAGLTPDEAATQLHILSACVVGFGFAIVWGRELAAGARPERPAGPPHAAPQEDLRPYLERAARWDAGEFATALDIVLGAYGREDAAAV